MAAGFVPGQRWISEAEPDLGLGVVEQADPRQVRVLFTAAGQQRNYALRNAPLSRVRFDADDSIEDQDGRVLSVVSVEQHDGLLSYHCTDAAGAVVVLPEQSLNPHLRLNRPHDRLLARRVDPDVWFTLRYRTWLQSAAQWRSPVFGLCGPRIDLIPHQLYIAAEVASRSAPRVLLADEVGLGKTIEAGLILHRLILTERVQRVLVVVPDALVNQWLVEMLRRFNLRFAVFDEERFEQSEAGNPFHSEQRVLCSLSFLTALPPVGRAVLEGDWDLLVVDEAHHLAWSEQETGLEYQLVEALCSRTAGVLLLTATPEQLGRAGHFGRLRLLDPQRFHDYGAFVAEEADYAPVAELAARLVEGVALADEDRRRLEALLGDEADLSRAEVIDRLIDRHGTGRVLFRNTRQAIKGFPARRLHAIALPLPDRYATLVADCQPERAYGEGWAAFDPRVGWLRDLLRRVAPDKVLVICAHAETAIELRDQLLECCAMHAAIFHERMEIVARDRAAAFFADPDEGAQVLICSEIGSEGRNFQFAHHLVLFDLPLEPDLLEQRIGRLDRIGQRDTIELHVPYFRGAAGEVLLRWYRDGLNSFAAVCPAAGAVFERLGDRLRDTLHDVARIDALVTAAADLTRRINAELEGGRDRLLELHSHRPGDGEALVDAVRDAAKVSQLTDYLAAYWDAFGVEHEPGPGGSVVLRTGSHMLHDHFPGLDPGGVTVTLARGDALAHEDRQFLTWEHPMVRGCMEMLVSEVLGTAAVTVCSHPDFRTGSVLLELLYVLECAAPPGLEVQRFLPPTCMRLVLDAQGVDRADSYPHEALAGLCLSRNRKLMETVINSQGVRIKLLLKQAEQLADERGAEVARDAIEVMHRQLDGERRRLVALAKVNPNVRQDEIDGVLARREMIAAQMRSAKVRLDAARIVVMR